MEKRQFPVKEFPVPGYNLPNRELGTGNWELVLNIERFREDLQ